MYSTLQYLPTIQVALYLGLFPRRSIVTTPIYTGYKVKNKAKIVYNCLGFYTKLPMLVVKAPANV